MYLRFTPIAPFPLASAVLTLSFTDLDLSGVNDPSGFTETIPFFSATNSALTSVITTAPGSGSSPLAYTVTGNSTNQTIVFSDVRSIITTDPFYLKLVFGSKETYSGNFTNTMESLTATLTTSTAAVPEPTSMLLLGSGLIALGAWRRAQR
ncbi:MAG TPA: PEP-CTERM sorting domain-containing protein [Terriglobia bacterium]|nr:PEP-CTERM sorting domain-containing protein [Terriglobia bacterium]